MPLVKARVAGMRKHLVDASPRHHVPAKKDSHGSANRLYRDGFTRTPVPSSTGRRERNGFGDLLFGLARAETINAHTVRSASPRQSDACGPRVRRPGMRD